MPKINWGPHLERSNPTAPHHQTRNYDSSVVEEASVSALVLLAAFDFFDPDPFFLVAAALRFLSASLASTSRGLSTSSIIASSARSPSRCPSFHIRGSP